MPVQLSEEWLHFEAAIGARPMSVGKDVAEIRKNSQRMRVGPPPDPSSSTTLDIVDDIVGDRSVRVRIYTPKSGILSLPIGVFMHGGGWCVGDLDSEDALARHIAESTPMALISVDYKLAPENKWPASLLDCISVAKWALERYARSGADVSKGLLVGGASSGAQLAISATAKLLEQGVPVRTVVALAPLTISPSAVPQELKSNGKYQSMTENSDGPLVSPELLNIFLEANAADPNDSSFSVYFNGQLSKFPPTYIVTCGSDILRDDGRLLAEKLEKLGVEVKHDDYPGYPHVFWVIPRLKILDNFYSSLKAGITHGLVRK